MSQPTDKGKAPTTDGFLSHKTKTKNGCLPVLTPPTVNSVTASSPSDKVLTTYGRPLRTLTIVASGNCRIQILGSNSGTADDPYTASPTAVWRYISHLNIRDGYQELMTELPPALANELRKWNFIRIVWESGGGYTAEIST